MSERLLILELIEANRISVEEGLRRLEALETGRLAGAVEPESASATTGGPASADTAFAESEFDRPGFVSVVWQIVFGVGIALLVGGGLLLTRAYANVGMPGLTWGWVLFVLGLLVMGSGWWLRRARWFYLRVCEHGGRTFTIVLPLPLGIVIWLLHVARPFVPQLEEMELDELVRAMKEELQYGRPLAVHVDEGDSGDRVELYFR